MSVVVVTRNEEAHVARTLAAVLAARRSLAAEVVLVDSASHDRTVEIAGRYPVRIVRLRPSPDLCAAFGRQVGLALTAAPYVQFLDGDSTVEPGWVEAAMAALDGDTLLAGVAGREDQVYYRHGAVVGERSDYFGTGDRVARVQQLGGNALYRRAALDAVGGFHPRLRANEEAELGVRLRRAGWTLARIPVAMAVHHTPRPDGPAEYWRRLRSGLIAGQGRALRVALGDGLFLEHARRLDRQLAFIAWTAAGVMAAAMGTRRGFGGLVLWTGASLLLFAVFVVRARSVARPARIVLDWAISAAPIVWGFLRAAPCRTPIDLAAAVAWDSGWRAPRERHARATPPRRTRAAGAGE